MNKQQTTSLKGICAILILLHHISLYAPQTFSFPLSLFQRIGCLVCAVFFMLSGYGIYLSYERDANRFIKGFGKRMAKLMLPFVVWELIDIAWLTFDGIEYRISAEGGFPFGNWFVWVLIFQYMLFVGVWTVFKKLNFTVKWLICLIGTFLLNWFLRDIGWPGWWYNSSLAFPVGLLIAKEKNKLPDLVEKKYNYLIAIVAAMIYFLLRYIIGKYPENYWVDLLNIVSSVFFALAVVFVWLKINLKGRLWRHLGEVSYYIFLTQFVVFHIFAGNHIYITDKWLFAITSGCTCILFAEVSCYIFRNTKGQVNDKNI